MAGSARRTRVALLFGGRSTEHSISCVSAAGVLRALDRDRYEVVPIGITAEGSWLRLPDDPEPLSPRDGRLPVVTSAGGAAGGLGGPGAAGRLRARGRRCRVPAAARPVRRGRHGAGPAGDGRVALRRLGRVRERRGYGQAAHEDAAGGGRADGGSLRRAPGRSGPRRTRPGAARPAGLRQARAWRVEHRDQPGRRVGRSRHRGQGRPSRRPEGGRRGGSGRQGDRMRGAGRLRWRSPRPVCRPR